MARDIPGFYYDEEKKKYFKILPNHVAPSGSRYSKGAIRKERVQKHKKGTDLKDSILSSRIQHGPILNHLFGAVIGMDREIGRRCTRSGSLWACGLNRMRTLEFYSQRKSSASQLQGEFDQTITSILKDEGTGTIFVGSSSTNAAGGNSLLGWMPNFEPQAEELYPHLSKSLVTYDGKSDITSICMTPARILISTTLGAPEAGGSITMTKLYEADSWETWPLIDQGVTLRLRPSSNISSTFYDSSANPDQTSSISLAIAADTGVLFLKESQIHYTDWLEDFHKTNSAVFSVNWLSPTLLTSGCRNGAVWLYDIRSQGRTLRIQHPSSVTHVKQADEWRLVIAGLQNNLHTYDLRFPKISDKHLNDTNITNPYLSYPKYINSAHPSLGFDLSPSLGLIAAATDECGVQLFEIWTGKEVAPGWGKEKKWNEMIRSLKFTGDHHGEGSNVRGDSEGLLLGIQGIVEEWGF